MTPPVASAERAGRRATIDLRTAKKRRRIVITGAIVLLALLGAAVAWRAAGSDGGADGSLGAALGYHPSGGTAGVDRLADVERWLGRPIVYTVQFADRRSPAEMRRSVFGQLKADDAALPKLADRVRLSMAVPLAFGAVNAKSPIGVHAVKENLDAVASGRYDEDYRVVARHLVDGGFRDAIIRLGYEFSADWSPWSSQGNETAFIAAWRHVHDVLQSVSNDFTFDWTSTVESFVEHGPLAYPGDDYVDLVGLDLYFRPSDGHLLGPGEFEQRFRKVLREHLEFATAHGKQVSYPEWGMRGADDASFIRAMYQWMDALPDSGPGSLRYQSYFSAANGYELTSHPRAAAEYRRLFGSG